MCFFDMYQYGCGDWKWGHFRQHCNREYRTGETCGIKLVMDTNPVADKCKICQKIETKQRRWQAEAERVKRWEKDGGKLKASIDRSKEVMRHLESEVSDLCRDRMERFHNVASR